MHRVDEPDGQWLALLPPSFVALVHVFNVLDKSYCFLIKNRLECTIPKLLQICNQLLPLTDIGTTTEWASVSKSFCRLLQSICPEEFDVVKREQGVECWECRRHAGAGAGHIRNRRKAVVEALLRVVASQVVISLHGIISDEVISKAVSSAKKKGWPPSTDISNVKLPVLLGNESPVNIENSSTAPPTISSQTTAVTDSRETPQMQDFDEVLQMLRDMPWYRQQIKHVIRYPGRESKYSELRYPLPDELQHRLRDELCISKLYSHQVKAIDAIRDGKHVVISTATSSGKSLIFNIPVFERLLQDSSSIALYLFPTKALSQDQLRAIKKLIGSQLSDRICPVTCDGDTARVDRLAVQQGRGNIIISNPDMLHVTILPDHKRWRRIFENLRYVIIDEAHQYSGSFGAHVACVMRRLIRLCLYHGSSPQFVFCSATISNPLEHAQRLVPLRQLKAFCLESDVILVDKQDDGAPSGSRTFVIWNPYDNAETSSRPQSAANYQPVEETELQDIQVLDGADSYQRSTSPMVEMAKLFTAMVKTQHKTIAFCGTRKLVELVYQYSTKVLQQDPRGNELLPRIASYRGGYREEERREIESALFQDQLLGVAATCALELGIDVGSLDVTLHMGFPGSFSSLWQQAGRAGRHGQAALSIISCFESALDQYFAAFPLELLESEVESALLDVSNIHVLRGHLCCAAKELPLNSSIALLNNVNVDAELWSANYADILSLLVDAHMIHARQPSQRLRSPDNSNANEVDHWRSTEWSYWSPGRFAINEAAKDVSLRMIDPVSISLLNSSSNQILDTVEYSRAFFQLFEGAIVLYRGRQYLVTKLDLASLTAHASPVRVQYFTSAQNETQINVVKRIEQIHDIFCFGTLQVIAKVIGFEKRRMITGHIFETGVCSLPPLEFETSGVWIDVPLRIMHQLQREGLDCASALHGCNHLLSCFACSMGQCDANDIGSEHENSSTVRSHPPRIMIYDRRPGGLGMSSTVFTHRRAILLRAIQLLDNCKCISGCHRCIFEKRCPAHNQCLSKSGARLVLAELIACESQERVPSAPSSPETSRKRITDVSSLENTPSKRSKQMTLARTAMKDSDRSKSLQIQKSWTAMAPDFVTDFDLQQST